MICDIAGVVTYISRFERESMISRHYFVIFCMFAFVTVQMVDNFACFCISC